MDNKEKSGDALEQVPIGSSGSLGWQRRNQGPHCILEIKLRLAQLCVIILITPQQTAMCQDACAMEDGMCAAVLQGVLPNKDNSAEAGLRTG